MRGRRAITTTLLAGLPCLSGCTDAYGSAADTTSSSFDATTEDGASSVDGGADAAELDAAEGSDAQAEAGRALSALSFTSGCASRAATTALALSDVAFTVTFWVVLRTAATPGVLHPVVGAGGRSSVDPGWTVAFDGAVLTACAGDSGLRACAGTETLTPGHRVHVGVVSDLVVGQSGARKIQLYLLDADAGETAHRLSASTTGAANNWPATASFAIGGAAAPSCVATIDAVVDEVRIWNELHGTPRLDADYARAVPCGTANLVASYRVDEGTGTAASDCVAGYDLTVSGSYAWVVSPFP